ncbi:MAG: hypothetical protein AAGG81_05345 [Chlamydiota bacterium]
MFKKPKKKRHFPPGTFIPTKARVLAILQLCIAFSVICYNLGAPFLGEVFEVREQQSLYQSIMNHHLFHELSATKQDEVIESYQELMAFGHRSFGVKLSEALRVFFMDMPPFKLAWVFLSVIVPIMLLKKVEGAKLAVWMIPLVTILYAIDSFLFYPSKPISNEQQLFPIEDYLVDHYLQKPLSPTINEQKKELKEAWDRYLVTEWAGESKEGKDLVSQGAFAFNMARLEAREEDQRVLPHYEWKQPFLKLFLYLSWNFYFAYGVTRSLRQTSQN